MAKHRTIAAIAAPDDRTANRLIIAISLRPHLVRTTDTAELAAADHAFARLAVSLGCRGQVSHSHAAVRTELTNRQPNLAPMVTSVVK